MSDYLVVTTSVPNKEVAEEIAHRLLRKHIASCVQIIGPIESHYWWENKLNKSVEYLCLAKTKKEFYSRLEAEIIEHHPYTTPEVYATPITHAFGGYQSWIDDCLK